MFYQIHEDHGKHIAQNFLEKKANEDQGWQTVSEAVWLAYKPGHMSVSDAKEGKDDLQELRDAYEAAFGKKPHHKWSADKIRGALNADGE